MKLEPRNLVVPIVALVVLALVLQQTISALKASGSWQHAVKAPAAQGEDPYSRVDNLFAQDRPRTATANLRNPFAFGSGRAAPATGVAVKPVQPKIVAPHEAPKPKLTSIVWDNDPRATVRYDGKDFSVRVNSLFAEFRVDKITANEVVLDRGGEQIVLSLRSKGD